MHGSSHKVRSGSSYKEYLGRQLSSLIDVKLIITYL